MIKINLAPGERSKDFTKIGGIDLSLINIKLLLPFILAVYIVEPIVDSFYLDDIKIVEEKMKATRKKTGLLRDSLRGYDSVKKQVKELNAQEKKLTSKIRVVREIVNKRQNPFKVLKYIAENTPKDIWVVELEIDGKNLKLVGYSKSWKSIGDFIENLKVSIFLNGSVNYIKPATLKKEFEKNRVESFEITTGIVSFK